MLYPIFSYDDGTEVTASKPDLNGNIKLYIEKFDTEKDMFINATFFLPGVTIVSFNGYSEDEINVMIKEYKEIQDDVINYVKELEKKSA